MGSSRSRSYAALLAAVLLAATVTACSSDAKPKPTTTPTSSPSPTVPTQLTFAVYGPAPVITAYTRAAGAFTAAHPRIVVNVRTYPSRQAALVAVEAGGPDAPDVFLADRADVPGLIADGRLRAVDDLLGERGVDFGDGFQRNALEQFSADAHLQCMPVSFSPLVLFYNTDLLDVTEIARGTTPHDPTRPFSMTEWATAAQLATGPGHRGVYVAPTLEQVAPFVWSAGGQVVDDPSTPTTLSLESGASSSGIESLLEVVRNPAVTYSEAALQKKSALRRFRSGQLGMILGYRDLVPTLRQTTSLHFDVMPLPKVGSAASIGESTGGCLARRTPHAGKAADFLAYLVSDAGQSVLAETGYVVPANLDVANDDAFLQPGQEPAHADVFNDAIRGARELPTGQAWSQVTTATANALSGLFYDPVIDPLADRLKEIDSLSAPILAPPTPSPTPTTTPTG